MNKTQKRLLDAARADPLRRVQLALDPPRQRVREHEAACVLHAEGLGIYTRESFPPEFRLWPLQGGWVR